MQKIACLIPTFGRYQKLQPFVEDFEKHSRKSTLYFIVHPDDEQTLEELKRLKKDHDFQILATELEYVGAINLGVSETIEEFIFCGADDILFSPRWDSKLLEIMAKPWVNVTGGVDDWVCSRSGVHVSHPLIRRKYVVEQGANFNSKGYLYSPEYKHYQCDIEMEQLAWARGCIKLCQDVTIHHNHFVNKKTQKDTTYSRSFKVFEKDQQTYDARRAQFEWWDVAKLHGGQAVPSQFRMKRLSVVMPIWNCKSYVKQTLESLLKTTKHPYELILIDDHSTEFKGAEFLQELETKAREKFLIVKTVANTEQKYCNHNWNLGVSMATGDYIAIINSDIEFQTNEWDDFLIENIDIGYDLVSPFQADRVCPGTPYMLPKPPDAGSRQHLRGACFMMSREFSQKAIPIPSDFKHWCGDDYIGDLSKTWLFDIRVSIFHYLSKSGEKVNQLKFWTMVLADCQNYQKAFGKDMSVIINNCQKRVKQLTRIKPL